MAKYFDLIEYEKMWAQIAKHGVDYCAEHFVDKEIVMNICKIALITGKTPVQVIIEKYKNINSKLSIHEKDLDQSMGLFYDGMQIPNNFEPSGATNFSHITNVTLEMSSNENEEK